ncbi:MAG: hypothetical protein ACKVVP_22155 [Chloroflexota bacterium]
MKRTTLTLEDDVIEQVQIEMSRSGLSFKDTVNAVLRRGLGQASGGVAPPLLIPGKPLGLRPGLSIDNLEDLLDETEGPFRR